MRRCLRWIASCQQLHSDARGETLVWSSGWTTERMAGVLVRFGYEVVGGEGGKGGPSRRG